MEQQPRQSRSRRHREEEPQLQPQSLPQREGALPDGAHYKDYPQSEGRMIIRDNFKKGTGEYN